MYNTAKRCPTCQNSLWLVHCNLCDLWHEWLYCILVLLTSNVSIAFWPWTFNDFALTFLRLAHQEPAKHGLAQGAVSFFFSLVAACALACVHIYLQTSESDLNMLHSQLPWAPFVTFILNPLFLTFRLVRVVVCCAWTKLQCCGGGGKFFLIMLMP